MPDAVDLLLDEATAELVALGRSVVELSVSVQALQGLLAAVDPPGPAPAAPSAPPPTTLPVPPPLPRARTAGNGDARPASSAGEGLVARHLLAGSGRRRAAPGQRRRELFGFIVVLLVVAAILAIPLLLWG